MSNSLAAVHPELIIEWSDRNLPLTPDSVTFGSNKKVWWKGACGHEWETSMVKTCGSFTDVKKPEHALKLFVRFALAKGVITYGMELMLALFNIVQGTISTIMNAAGFGTPEQTTLPAEMVTTIEDCGFFESIPLWAVTLIGGLFITVLSFILIMTVYGRFFKLYMYTALAPIPLSTFAGEPTQNVGKSFIKSYCAVLLEGAVIVLACIIFSVFASSPPVVNPDAAAVTQVWAYILLRVNTL